MRLAALTAALLIAAAPLCARASAIGSQRVSGKAIAAAAAQTLAHVEREANADYVPASVVSDQLVSDGRVQLRAQSPVGSPSFVNVPVQIEVDGRLDRTVLVGYRIQQFVETAVAARDLPAGTVLQPDDLQMARVPATGRMATGVDLLTGRKLNSAMAKGLPITLGDTGVNQLVKAGATVVFTVRNGPVLISADAVARTAGGFGDQVFVYNPATHKQLSGTVTGPNAVELDITEGSTP